MAGGVQYLGPIVPCSVALLLIVSRSGAMLRLAVPSGSQARARRFTFTFDESRKGPSVCTLKWWRAQIADLFLCTMALLLRLLCHYPVDFGSLTPSHQTNC